MAFALSLLRRFGFFMPTPDSHDSFDHRLTRIGTRESRREVRASVFVKTRA